MVPLEEVDHEGSRGTGLTSPTARWMNGTPVSRLVAGQSFGGRGAAESGVRVPFQWEFGRPSWGVAAVDRTAWECEFVSTSGANERQAARGAEDSSCSQAPPAHSPRMFSESSDRRRLRGAEERQPVVPIEEVDHEGSRSTGLASRAGFVAGQRFGPWCRRARCAVGGACSSAGRDRCRRRARHRSAVERRAADRASGTSGFPESFQLGVERRRSLGPNMEGDPDLRRGSGVGRRSPLEED